MADDREEDRGFTVADKRRFVSEKTDTEADQRAPLEGAADESGARKQAGLAEDARGREEKKGDADARGQSERAAAEEERPEPTPAITMATFIMSMSTQVLMLMGEIASPATGEVERDVTAAKQVIDILGMLRAKTEGNLDDNERDLFEHVLYDLRMRYVELMKRKPHN